MPVFESSELNPEVRRAINNASRQASLNLSAAMPPGATIMYGGATAPTGWFICDGSAVSRVTYAALFAAIGVTWGVGDGSTTFNLPDLRGRTPIGVGTGAGLTARALAALVGAETHLLTGNESGTSVHNHTQNSHNHTQDAHNHTINNTTAASVQGLAGGATAGFQTSLALNAATSSTNNHTAHGHTAVAATATNQATTATNIATAAANAANAHNNMQPSAAINFIIKA